GGLQLEAAGKDRQPPPEELLWRSQQVKAPIDRCPQALMPDTPGPATSGQQPKPLIQLRQHLLDGECAQPNSGQLQGQGKAVQTAAQAADCRHIYRRDLELRPG